MKRKVIAITTTKTARHKDAKEYYISDYGSYEQTVLAALKANPRKKKFYELVMFEDTTAVANPVTLNRKTS